jgi:Alpha/beta hydrolase domain
MPQGQEQKQGGQVESRSEIENPTLKSELLQQRRIFSDDGAVNEGGGHTILMNTFKFFRRSILVAVAVALLAWAPSSQARVTRIILDPPTALTGPGIPYETIAGRAWGELDPSDPLNALITDIALAPKKANGKVEYIASFFIVKPVDMSQASGVMWHDVPNRGGRITITADLRNLHDVGLSSGWQGDNAGATAVPANAADIPGTPPFGTNEWVKVPVVTGVTGRIFGRIINRSGLTGQPLNVMGNPIPYFPVNSADNSGATLTTHTHETIDGVVTVGETIPNSDWKFCGGGTFAAPTPVTTLPVLLCLKNGFDPAKLYELVYTVKDPYVLGAGTAAFRDVGSFFKYDVADDFGTANPLAGHIKWEIIRGSSQSGNFTRHYIHLGMNQDEAGRIVHEGAWPLIAGRRVANNSRWGQPDGVLELYQMGSEGPQWWHKFPDHVRGLPPGGILERCESTNTCPKIVETFGGAEVFALKMTTSWVGTSANNDIPLPKNVRRYYLPGSTHGGGNGATTENPADTGVGCPGNNWGRGDVTGQSSAGDRAGKPAADCVARLVDAQHPSAAKPVADLERKDSGGPD